MCSIWSSGICGDSQREPGTSALHSTFLPCRPQTNRRHRSYPLWKNRTLLATMWNIEMSFIHVFVHVYPCLSFRSEISASSCASSSLRRAGKRPLESLKRKAAAIASCTSSGGIQAIASTRSLKFGWKRKNTNSMYGFHYCRIGMIIFMLDG